MQLDVEVEAFLQLIDGRDDGSVGGGAIMHPGGVVAHAAVHQFADLLRAVHLIHLLGVDGVFAPGDYTGEDPVLDGALKGLAQHPTEVVDGRV